MIYMVSYIQVNGRLTQEPVVKAVKTRKGEVEVVEIAIASNNYIGGKNYTTFYNVTLWPGRAEKLRKDLIKGSAILVTGQFYQYSYTSKDGQEKTYNGINLHSICMPVCDHKFESSDLDTDFMDDNDIATEHESKEETEEPKRKKAKK